MDKEAPVEKEKSPSRTESVSENTSRAFQQDAYSQENRGDNTPGKRVEDQQSSNKKLEESGVLPKLSLNQSQEERKNSPESVTQKDKEQDSSSNENSETRGLGKHSKKAQRNSPGRAEKKAISSNKGGAGENTDRHEPGEDDNSDHNLGGDSESKPQRTPERRESADENRNAPSNTSLKRYTDYASDIVNAPDNQTRDKAFSDAAKSFQIVYPGGTASQFQTEFNKALARTPGSEEVRVVSEGPHAMLLDAGSVSKENPAGIASDQFIGDLPNRDGDAMRKLASPTAQQFADALRNPGLTDSQSKDKINEILSNASSEALKQDSGKPQEKTLEQLRTHVIEELNRKWSSNNTNLPEFIAGKSERPTISIVNENGQPRLKLNDEQIKIRNHSVGF